MVIVVVWVFSPLLAAAVRQVVRTAHYRPEWAGEVGREHRHAHLPITRPWHHCHLYLSPEEVALRHQNPALFINVMAFHATTTQYASHSNHFFWCFVVLHLPLSGQIFGLKMCHLNKYEHVLICKQILYCRAGWHIVTSLF